MYVCIYIEDLGLEVFWDPSPGNDTNEGFLSP